MALLTIVRRVDIDKLMRQSKLLLRVLMCFDVFFIVSTIVEMIWSTPALVVSTEHGDWDLEFLVSDVYMHGYCILSIFTTSFICNCLASAGIGNNKRMLLLPWLIVFTGFEVLLVLCFISDILYNPFSLSQILLLLMLLMVMSAWRHMQVVFVVMGLPRPASSVSTVESAASDKASQDFPPKYEDVTEKPPKYDEATMTQ